MPSEDTCDFDYSQGHIVYASVVCVRPCDGCIYRCVIRLSFSPQGILWERW